MVAPKMTLMYFDLDAVAEPVRLALAMYARPWEDKRISFDDFPSIKPALPYGQVPILEVDGKVLPQSLAQLRYIGKLAGLYPHDPFEAALADAAVDCVTDMHIRLVPTLTEKDKTKKLAMRQEMMDNFLITWMANLEKNLKGAGGEYFAGEKLSIGDIAVVARMLWLKDGSLDGIPTTLVDDYPFLAALVERVCAEPKIAAYHDAKLAKKNEK